MNTRAIVSRKTLDALIRAKLATLEGCAAIEALPVTWNGNGNGGNGHNGCNWVIPGWVGDGDIVASCVQGLEHYLAFLQEQFNIPTRSASAS